MEQFTVVVTCVSLIGGALYYIMRFVAWVLERSEAPSIAPPDQPMTTMTLDQYEERLAAKISESEAKLTKAHDDEKAVLIDQIEELKRRAADPEAALAEAKETIAKLEQALAREGNEHDISEAKMAEARDALEHGDFSLADDIFAEIEAREELAVKRAARAAFARGEIAEQDIRWADALAHYKRAAALDPSCKTLRRSWDFYWKLGDGVAAEQEAILLGNAVKDEFGEDSEEFGAYLSCHAISLKMQGNYDAAEPLYVKAIEIDKKTIGEDHPDYAGHLNNLALLYQEQGKYDAAGPLFFQAIKIAEQALGSDHPYTKTVKTNYERFLAERPDDP